MANSGTALSASTPLTEEDFPEFQRHAEALAFWEDASLGIDALHWHFNPKEFIGHFRKCGWLSTDELRQITPGAAVADVRRFRA